MVLVTELVARILIWLPYSREKDVRTTQRCSCLIAALPVFRSYKPILEYIDTQFEKYLEEELKIKRSLFNCHDTRIHICLYFIAPNGHSLKSLDLVTMKKLDSKVRPQNQQSSPVPQLVGHPVLLINSFFPNFFIPAQVNIIPVIAKADTVSKSELDKLKIKIMSELVSNGVQIYQFPTEDEAVAEINSSMNVSPGNMHTHLHDTRPVLRIVRKVVFLYHCSVTKAPPHCFNQFVPDQLSFFFIE